MGPGASSAWPWGVTQARCLGSPAPRVPTYAAGPGTTLGTGPSSSPSPAAAGATRLQVDTPPLSLVRSFLALQCWRPSHASLSPLLAPAG